jgi:hypothetical protein
MANLIARCERFSSSQGAHGCPHCEERVVSRSFGYLPRSFMSCPEAPLTALPWGPCRQAHKFTVAVLTCIKLACIIQAARIIRKSSFIHCGGCPSALFQPVPHREERMVVLIARSALGYCISRSWHYGSVPGHDRPHCEVWCQSSFIHCGERCPISWREVYGRPHREV